MNGEMKYLEVETSLGNLEYFLHLIILCQHINKFPTLFD